MLSRLFIKLGTLLFVGLIVSGCTEFQNIQNVMGFGSNLRWGADQPLTLEQAVERARHYVDNFEEFDLQLAEVMQFDNHFYASTKEIRTGKYAFEFLISLDGNQIWPEPGPNMMWNTKYGHMGVGMMGGLMNDPNTPMDIDAQQCRQLAQGYLDRMMPGLTVNDHADEFYGYYTLHTLQDDHIVGMLSVNGATGEIWPHTWHGQFIEMWSNYEAYHH